MCVDLNAYNTETRNLDIISVFWCLQTIWAWSSASMASFTLSKGLWKGEDKNLGFTLPFKRVNLLPTWMGRVSFQQRGTLLLLHMAQVHCPSFSCNGKSISTHLIMFWSTSCMYWHTDIIYNTYITYIIYHTYIIHT